MDLMFIQNREEKPFDKNVYANEDIQQPAEQIPNIYRPFCNLPLSKALESLGQLENDVFTCLKSLENELQNRFSTERTIATHWNYLYELNMNLMKAIQDLKRFNGSLQWQHPMMYSTGKSFVQPYTYMMGSQPEGNHYANI